MQYSILLVAGLDDDWQSRDNTSDIFDPSIGFDISTTSAITFGIEFNTMISCSLSNPNIGKNSQL